MRVLHIAPHLGGGAGRFLANIARADSQNQHEFCLLESPIDTHLLAGISWLTFNSIQDRLDEYVAKFDIVQIEFWNHPLLFKFLMEHRLPSCRLIIYAHVSGIYAPNIIPQGMFDFADTVVLSTPAAMEQYSAHIQKGKCRVIHEIGGVARTSGLQKVKHTGINIAYIGTASYSKLHPGFIQACRTLLKKAPEVRFTIASNDDNGHLRAESEDLGIGNHFDFFYRTDDIESILCRTDLFGYPLRPDHFGTGEQSILEAMGAGVVPIVIGNPAEKSLIEDGVTGVIANDIYDYVGAIQYCIEHPAFTSMVGAQAKAFASENFSVKKTGALFDSLYQHAMIKPKAARQFKDFLSFDKLHPGWSFFKLCLGNHADLSCYENTDDDMLRQYFRDKIMRSPHLMNENKGGMRMYHKCFPDDTRLSQFLMQKAFRVCPVCGGHDCNTLHHQRFLLPEGHPLKDGYDVVCCMRCGFVYADTAATQADYDVFYARHSIYQQAHSIGGGETPCDADRLTATARYVSDFIQDKNARILDIGCANGGLLRAFYTLGYTNLCGLDPSPVCATNTKAAVIEAYTGDFTSMPHGIGFFDVICLSHVMEHVLDLDAAIQAICKVLKPGGLCYVETPDALRYAAFVTTPFQDFKTEHINHFSKLCLTNLFKIRTGWIFVAGGEKTFLLSPNNPYPACHVLFRREEFTSALSEPIQDNYLISAIMQYIDLSRALLDKIEANLKRTLEIKADLIIWGTGELCKQLLAETSLANANIVAFVDSNPVHWGSVLKGIPIQSPDIIKDINIPILITSMLRQAEIENAIRTKYGLLNPVMHLL